MAESNGGGHKYYKSRMEAIYECNCMRAIYGIISMQNIEARDILMTVVFFFFYAICRIILYACAIIAFSF